MLGSRHGGTLAAAQIQKCLTVDRAPRSGAARLIFNRALIDIGHSSCAVPARTMSAERWNPVVQIHAFACTHRTMSDLLIAPDWRAISLPPLNSAMVGILRIANSLARAGSASVFSFASRT